MNRRHIVGGLAGIAAATLGSLASGHESRDSAPPSGVRSGRRPGRLPNVALRTHENQAVRFYDDLVRAKTVLINFMYTACMDDCPLTMATLARVQQGLGPRSGRDVFIYSITVDPGRDTPEVLARYARAVGARPGWTFVTGTRRNIDHVRKGFGDDPSLPAARSDHLNLLNLGIEPLARWSGVPTWTRPETLLRYLAWMEPNGARPGIERTV